MKNLIFILFSSCFVLNSLFGSSVPLKIGDKLTLTIKNKLLIPGKRVTAQLNDDCSNLNNMIYLTVGTLDIKDRYIKADQTHTFVFSERIHSYITNDDEVIFLNENKKSAIAKLKIDFGLGTSSSEQSDIIDPINHCSDLKFVSLKSAE